MREVPTTEFTRNFGRYREIVQREPVAVMSHGRPTGYFVSAVEYEELQHYKNLARQSFATRDLSREDVEAVASGRMSSEHDHLNALMDTK
ncbi:type II toxin-antitoxin system prevent-host-death family antitoxin [Mesorhizobium sp.]|uniref:type II toxin-antitoxin system prevent-host-death family antitoxin n=1 Tax=Mesorhizobium sp. TaxID=1871066 RepID=UPI000FE4763A|nr:type II toxin-antitoxin system prevent-host-death family antitoxin [Mesorhizobium sp.]RWC23920.1 MAG: type II toxin-antitoxin system prevent-host-death family antitoxin [Mesorhizobium sp.]TIX21591.1 MAG: type II toxin-antitoxin system prevent-host-death family antitoxin [Mesorhizobium sp.]